MRRLDGSVALVTGASSGIGWATAKALAAEGAKVGLAGRTEAKLKDLAHEIEAEGGEALVLPTDMRSREQVQQMVDLACDAFGRLDILVNNAGVGYWSPLGIVDAILDQWRDEIEVNLMGLMVATHAAAKRMLQQRAGHIVNVSSLAGRYPAGPVPGYVTSKFGVNGFTESARRDLRQHGIRVTLVEPDDLMRCSTSIVARIVELSAGATIFSGLKARSGFSPRSRPPGPPVATVPTTV